MAERSSKRLSFIATNNTHRLSDGIHPFASSFALRPCEMTESLSQHTFAFDHPSNLQWVTYHRDNELLFFFLFFIQFSFFIHFSIPTLNRQRTLTATTVHMNDDEFVITPTRRLRANSILEESLLNAGNYLKRKFSYGSSDWEATYSF